MSTPDNENSWYRKFGWLVPTLIITFVLNTLMSAGLARLTTPRGTFWRDAMVTSTGDSVVITGLLRINHNGPGDLSGVLISVPSDTDINAIYVNRMIQINWIDIRVSKLNRRILKCSALPAGSSTLIAVPLKNADALSKIELINPSASNLVEVKSDYIEPYKKRFWRSTAITAGIAILLYSGVVAFLEYRAWRRKNWLLRETRDIEEQSKKNKKELEDLQRMFNAGQQYLRKRIAQERVWYGRRNEALKDENDYWRRVIRDLSTKAGAGSHGGESLFESVRRVLKTQAAAGHLTVTSDDLESLGFRFDDDVPPLVVEPGATASPSRLPPPSTTS